jgi:predicted porin
MQKKLIALAVAGVFAAPAFAATSNVDVYGQMDFSVNYVNSDVAGSVDNKDLVTAKSNASRIGFKGSEDLGGGMKALWQVETGFLQGSNNNATGYDSGFRNTFIGLGSSMGTVLLGRHDTPYKLATGKLDIFADNIGDYNAIIGGRSGLFGSSGGTLAGGAGLDHRADQTIAYISPTWSGFHVAGAYIGARVVEGAATDDEATGYSLMAMYDNGPFFASLAHEKHAGGAGASSATGEVKGNKLGLGYSFGNAKIGGVYEKTSQGGGVTTWDRNAWWLGGSYTMGNTVLKASYGNRGDSKVAGAKDGGKFYALGAAYNLSKRTNVYATYAKASDDVAGNVVMFGMDTTSAGVGGANNDPSVISVGMRHSF